MNDTNKNDSINKTTLNNFTKRKLGIILLCAIFIISVIMATIYIFPKKQTTTYNYTNNIQKDFDDYVNQLFFDQIKTDTLSLHFYLLHPEDVGLNSLPQTLGTYSYDSMKSGQEYYIGEINNLKAFNYKKLLANQQLTYDVLLRYFQDQLDFSDLCLCSQVLSPTTGIQSQLPVLFAEYKFTCKQDVDNYLTLLGQIKDYYSQICEFEKLKADNDCFLSDFCCSQIIDQCNTFIKDQKASDNFLFSSFNDKIEKLKFFTPTEKERYRTQNESIITDSVIPAYKEIITTLSDLKKKGFCKNNNGLYYLKNGCDYYEYLVKNQTGSSRSVIELKAAIQQQLAKDMKTMYSILTVNPRLEEQFYDESQSSLSPEEILTDIEKKAHKDFPISKNIKYQVKYVDESLQDYLSPAFYFSPPIDDVDHNVIYINPKNTSQDLYTTLAHEGIPGHMYQADFFASTNPMPIRQLINYGGYTEGWATYVEFMSYGYKTSNQQLAQALSCSASYSLALYSLCDIGVNYEGWTLEDTEKFLSNYKIDDKKVCESIFQAVVAEPANYLQYYVGYLSIVDLHHEMQKKLGTDFNLKKFHKALLSVGPASFDVVEKWIYYKYAQ